MPHLTGLSALAATDSSADKATTTTEPGLVSGLSMWKDPFEAAKEITNIGTIFSESTEKGIGFLLVPAVAVLVLLGLMKGGQ